MKRSFGKRIARLFAVALSLVVTTALTACFDLGSFGDENGDHEDYYDSFGEIAGLFDGGKHGYDLEDSVFNDYTVNEMGWEDEDDMVKSEAYVYIVIPFKSAMQIESVGLFVQTSVAADLSVSAFYYPNETYAPTKIKYKSSPDTEIVTVKDDEGNDVETEVEIVYDDPDPSLNVARTTFYAVAGDWSDFLLENFMQEGYEDGLLHTGDDGLLYIRIDDNSGLFPDRPTCSFTFINLLVRAI